VHPARKPLRFRSLAGQRPASAIGQRAVALVYPRADFNSTQRETLQLLRIWRLPLQPLHRTRDSFGEPDVRRKA
jgi:hypothetical protein